MTSPDTTEAHEVGEMLSAAELDEIERGLEGVNEAYRITRKLVAMARRSVTSEAGVREALVELAGGDPDRVAAVDALRLYVTDPTTFSFSYEDAEALESAIDTLLAAEASRSPRPEVEDDALDLLKGMVGLIQIITGRDDMPAEIGAAMLANHRYIDALAYIAAEASRSPRPAEASAPVAEGAGQVTNLGYGWAQSEVVAALREARAFVRSFGSHAPATTRAELTNIINAALVVAGAESEQQRADAISRTKAKVFGAPTIPSPALAGAEPPIPALAHGGQHE